MPERILMAIDDTPASEAAVDYAATLMGSSAGLHLHLVHVEPVSTRHMNPEDKAFREAQARSRELLDRMSERLKAAGVDAERIDTGFLAIPAEMPLQEALIGAARDQQCTTIALGRNALPWYKESVHAHLVDGLVQDSHGFSIWVVGPG